VVDLIVKENELLSRKLVEALNFVSFSVFGPFLSSTLLLSNTLVENTRNGGNEIIPTGGRSGFGTHPIIILYERNQIPLDSFILVAKYDNFPSGCNEGRKRDINKQRNPIIETLPFIDFCENSVSYCLRKGIIFSFYITSPFPI